MVAVLGIRDFRYQTDVFCGSRGSWDLCGECCCYGICSCYWGDQAYGDDVFDDVSLHFFKKLILGRRFSRIVFVPLLGDGKYKGIRGILWYMFTSWDEHLEV